MDGDYERACLIYDRILLGTPTDALALWTAQLMDYYLGNAGAMRERSGRVLARWSADMPGYHAVLSMNAFALQECGDYGAAEEAALRALELEPRDLRAQHTLLHVYEMVGQPEEGLRWAGRHALQWCGDAAVAHHLWWHAALFMTAVERPHEALAIYDLQLQQDTLAGLIDASALLWRLHLERIDVGARFAHARRPLGGARRGRVLRVQRPARDDGLRRRRALGPGAAAARGAGAQDRPPGR